MFNSVNSVGGTGAGTVIRGEMRVLVETNDTGYVTTFTVEPREAGQHGYVTIATEMTGRVGVLGALERWFATRLLRPVYVKELEQLAAVAAKRAG